MGVNNNVKKENLIELIINIILLIIIIENIIKLNLLSNWLLLESLFFLLLDNFTINDKKKKNMKSVLEWNQYHYYFNSFIQYFSSQKNQKKK